MSLQPTNAGPETPALKRSALLAALAGTVAAVAGCATPPPSSDPAAVAAYYEANDPLEPLNRYVFALNEGADMLVIRPAAEIYHGVVPDPIEEAVRNFLANLASPLVIVNELLQGDTEGARITAERMFVNTTLGLGGLLDVATSAGIERSEYEDFGQTLATWGGDEGPYLVLPLLGPSNVRDALGTTIEAVADPVAIATGAGATAARWTASGIDTRAQMLQEVDDLRRNSVDYYATVRSLYRQKRAADIRDGAGAASAYPEFPDAGGGASGVDSGSVPSTSK